MFATLLYRDGATWMTHPTGSYSRASVALHYPMGVRHERYKKDRRSARLSS
jgi:hypothetical protein